MNDYLTISIIIILLILTSFILTIKVINQYKVNRELRDDIYFLNSQLNANQRGANEMMDKFVEFNENETKLKTELLELKDKCYIRKGRAFIPYRKYIAQELAAMGHDLKGCYEFTKQNKQE